MVEQAGGAGAGPGASSEPHRRDAHATDPADPDNDTDTDTDTDRPAWRPSILLITCEHGGHEVPESYCHLFTGAEEALRSHRGWDAGALTLAHRLAADLAAPVIFATTCRLLVELNRSQGHPELFSEFTRDLLPDQKRRLLADHYHPYREAVRSALTHAIGGGKRALHLSIHSFTPRLGADVRTVEAGLLFDPARPAEAALADWWLPRLRHRGLDARTNEPYKGTDDGLTTILRTELDAAAYAGLELEVRSDLLTGPRASALAMDLAADVRRLLGWRLPAQTPPGV